MRQAASAIAENRLTLCGQMVTGKGAPIAMPVFWPIRMRNRPRGGNRKFYSGKRALFAQLNALIISAMADWAP